MSTTVLPSSSGQTKFGIGEGLAIIELPPDICIDDTGLVVELPRVDMLDIDIGLLELDNPGFGEVDTAPCLLDEDCIQHRPYPGWHPVPQYVSPTPQ